MGLEPSTLSLGSYDLSAERSGSRRMRASTRASHASGAGKQALDAVRVPHRRRGRRLAASGTTTRFGAAGLQGNGTLTTDGTRVRFGIATLAGSGSLNATGTTTTQTVAPPARGGTLVYTSRTPTAGFVLGEAHLVGFGWLEATGLTPEGLPVPPGTGLLPRLRDLGWKPVTVLVDPALELRPPGTPTRAEIGSTYQRERT
jgi:hypothetical protein